MICSKCKEQIPEKTLKCTHCGAKIATLCRKCTAYNSIYNLNCVNCNNELLRICPLCKCVNLPSTKACRKCKHVLEPTAQIAPTPEMMDSSIVKIESNLENKVEQEQAVEDPDEPINLNYNTELFPQQKAKEILVEGLLSNNKKVLSISGQKGGGKSIVLKSAIHELAADERSWLIGECSAITQLSPCGLIQDILLMFFNVSNFCSNGLSLKKESQKFFQSEFPTLTNEEIFDLLNLLYPTNTDNYENILINKEKTFTFLEKVFKRIIENNKTIIVIENFELIDGFSYEFLHNLLNAEFSADQLKFLLTFDEIRPGRGYLYGNKWDDKNYLDVSLNSFDKNQMNAYIEPRFRDERCPSRVKESLFEISRGNPAILEQLVSLLFDFKARNNSFDIKFPTLLNDVIKMRLEYLKENPTAYKLLAMASIQGIKFYPTIINQILELEEKELLETLILLQDSNFITAVNEFSYTFKNSALWAGIFEVAKNDKDFDYFNKSLFSVYSTYTLSTSSIMPIIAQNVNQDLSALSLWTNITKLAAYIGDTNLYAIAQKQSLIFAEKLENNEDSPIINNIYERLGKLLSQSNPTEAIEYLSKAISSAKKHQQTIKEIELTGYLANCCIRLGDYYGTIECINATIEKIDDNFELEVAMLKSRKLDALLNVGNSGEIINLIDNEIMPVFDKYINSKPHKVISISSLYKAWMQTYLMLAYALISQGSNRSFDVITTLFELFEKNNFDNDLFICKTKLALAFANTIKGDIESSENILEELIKVYQTDIMDNEAISRWNLINILNNFIHKKYTGLKEELFQVVTFANNTNDHFTKNILKTLLGKLFKDEGNTKQAIEIYSEQITYFSKEKNAIGALLTWYLIAEANLVLEGPEKSLEVSQKALEIAQSPKINNYMFIVLYNKVIAGAYITQAEYELAKVHIEKAILVAKKFELLNILADLYLLYGKYLQDISLVTADAQVDYVVGAAKMYKKANFIALGIKNNNQLAKIEKSQKVLNSFCLLNGITLNNV